MTSINSMKAEAKRKRAMAESIDETNRAEALRKKAQLADRRAESLRKEAEDPWETFLGFVGAVILIIALVSYFAG